MQQAVASWDTARSFPMTQVLQRYRGEQEVDQATVDLHEQELKRYLFLCANYPEERWPMLRTIDELWHTFLLFTKDYQQFCTSLGRQFIHHEPFIDGADLGSVLQDYRRFLELYRSHFGEPPAAIWPDHLHQDGDCSSCGSGCSGGGCSGIGCGTSCGSSCR